MAFYTPILKNIWSLPIFCFMDEGLKDVLERSDEILSEHLEKIIAWVKQNMQAEYYVVFLWKDWNDIMSDVRAHDQVEKRWSWPLIDVKIFRNYEEETWIWVWSGNTVRVLGQLEEWRLKCKHQNIDFLNKPPVLDEELLLWEDFVL